MYHDTPGPLALAAVILGLGGCSLEQFKHDPVYAQAPQTCERKATVDDFDDHDDQILVQEGRGGYAYTFADKEGTTISPPESKFTVEHGGPSGSKYAVHIKGKLAGSGETYAGVGLDFRNPRKLYDASRYKGIAFMARAEAGSTTRVRFSVPDVNTDPDGKVCTACFNNFGISVDLTEEWTRFEVPWAELKQEGGWGKPRPDAIEPGKVIGVQWQVATPGSSFDIWIDNVTFTGCP